MTLGGEEMWQEKYVCVSSVRLFSTYVTVQYCTCTLLFTYVCCCCCCFLHCIGRLESNKCTIYTVQGRTVCTHVRCLHNWWWQKADRPARRDVGRTRDWAEKRERKKKKTFSVLLGCYMYAVLYWTTFEIRGKRGEVDTFGKYRLSCLYVVPVPYLPSPKKLLKLSQRCLATRTVPYSIKTS